MPATSSAGSPWVQLFSQMNAVFTLDAWCETTVRVLRISFIVFFLFWPRETYSIWSKKNAALLEFIRYDLTRLLGFLLISWFCTNNIKFCLQGSHYFMSEDSDRPRWHTVSVPPRASVFPSARIWTEIGRRRDGFEISGIFRQVDYNNNLI